MLFFEPKVMSLGYVTLTYLSRSSRSNCVLAISPEPLELECCSLNQREGNWYIFDLDLFFKVTGVNLFLAILLFLLLDMQPTSYQTRLTQVPSTYFFAVGI